MFLVCPTGTVQYGKTCYWHTTATYNITTMYDGCKVLHPHGKLAQPKTDDVSEFFITLTFPYA